MCIAKTLDVLSSFPKRRKRHERVPKDTSLNPFDILRVWTALFFCLFYIHFLAAFSVGFTFQCYFQFLLFYHFFFFCLSWIKFEANHLSPFINCLPKCASWKSANSQKSWYLFEAHRSWTLFQSLMEDGSRVYLWRVFAFCLACCFQQILDVCSHHLIYYNF